MRPSYKVEYRIGVRSSDPFLPGKLYLTDEWALTKFPSQARIFDSESGPEIETALDRLKGQYSRFTFIEASDVNVVNSL